LSAFFFAFSIFFAFFFPALDLLRLFSLLPAAAGHMAAAQPPLLPRLLTILSQCQKAAADDKPAAAASLMLLRGFANMSSRPELRAPVALCASSLLDTLHAPLEKGPSGARLAATTLLMNLVSLLQTSGGAELPAEVKLSSDASSLQALSLIAFALTTVPAITTPAEEESLHRLLVALAALLSGTGGGAAAGAADKARELELPAALAALTMASTASKAVVAARDRCAAAMVK